MEQQINFIEDIQNEVIKKECCYFDLDSLNKDRTKKDLILYLNIRSLNSNYESLKILIKRLKIKPYIIVCAETWKLDHHEYYKIDGYKIYYNSGHLNKADGVVVYIKEGVEEDTEIIEIGKLKILHTSITLNNNDKIDISAMYRSHDLPCTEFNLNFKKLLKNMKKLKNHLIIGDFNIDITANNLVSTDFLNSLMENGFYPGFIDTTRPSDDSGNGTCIDNIFIKSHSINVNTFKLAIPTPDHFPLFLEFNRVKNNEIKEPTFKYNYSQLNKIAKKIDWQEVLSIHEPNEAVNLLINNIQICINKIRYKVNTNGKKSSKVPRKSWITDAIVKSCKKKKSYTTK